MPSDRLVSSHLEVVFKSLQSRSCMIQGALKSLWRSDLSQKNAFKSRLKGVFLCAKSALRTTWGRLESDLIQVVLKSLFHSACIYGKLHYLRHREGSRQIGEGHKTTGLLDREGHKTTGVPNREGRKTKFLTGRAAKQKCKLGGPQNKS